MSDKLIFTKEERQETYRIVGQLRQLLGDAISTEDERKMHRHLQSALANDQIHRDAFGLNPLVLAFQTAVIAVEEIGLRRDGVLAILLRTSVVNGFCTTEEVSRQYGENVAHIIHGIVRIEELYKKNPVIESENFRNLLLSFAEDMRVILIMIADRVNLMRQIRDTRNETAKQHVSEEASYLYAPLAHKLGLYKLKSELEDLSLKYLEHDAYYHIKDKLNETKKSRNAYIERFIEPINKQLTAMGLKFHMKGRTKSIHSIWQKMKKQKCGFEGVYDLFAIRIINCYKYLVDEKHEKVMSKQLLRCGTSIGANTRESKNAQSRMDFLNKLNIALKEADETEYWLDLLYETKYIDDKIYDSLLSDCKELIAILVTIIKKIKENPDNPKEKN